MEFSPGEKRLLLDHAWDAIRSFIEGREEPCPQCSPSELTPALTRCGRVFVTLYLHGKPRGSMGTVLPVLPIWQACRENARNASYKDPRFMPLQSDDMPHVTLEVVIIDNPRPLDSSLPASGTRALMLSKGTRREVFLPGALAGIPGGMSEIQERLRSKVHIDADEPGDPEEWTVFDAEVIR